MCKKYDGSINLEIIWYKWSLSGPLIAEKNGSVEKHGRKKEGKDQESIQSITTPDPGYQWESDKNTIRHHKPEPRGQPFPSR